MIGLDFPKTAEKLFGRWRLIHLSSALGACLVLALILDLLSPSGDWVSATGIQAQYGTPIENVVLRWRDREDPRGFTTSAESGASPGEFGLAWISGSSISVRAKEPQHYFMGGRAYELTDVFAAQTKAINGKAFRVHEYMIQGARTGDIRRAALHAANDPAISAIVVSLNPVWLYNDLATFTKSNQRATVVSMKGAALEDWTTAPQYARPSSIFTAVVASQSRFIRARFAISRRFARRNEQKLAFPFLVKSETREIRYPKVYSLSKGRDMKAPPEMEWTAKHRTLLLMQTLDEHGRNVRFFKLALKSLAASGKPVLLYVAPLPPEIEHDRALLEFMGEWIDFTKYMTAKYGAANIHLHTASYRTIQGPRVHKDIVHLHYGQGVVDEVAGLLETDLGLKLDRIPDDGMYGGVQQ